ncbi:MAG: hypothetical protein WCE63_03235 [Acidobacteriaceae bacterium]
MDAFSVFGNVGRACDVKEMFAAFDQRFQHIDILVNNAGVQTWAHCLTWKKRDGTA